MTPLGRPVEPEVNRNLAIVSGPTAACAVSTAALSSCPSSSENSVMARLGCWLRVTTTSESGGTTASIARVKAVPSAAKTRPGVSRLMMWRSLA